MSSPPLAVFLRHQLTDRDESVRQFSDRTGLNESGLYQILRGERSYVSDRTLDKIAAGLGLTPAEMAAAMGRSADLAPDEAELLAIFRRVPSEHRPAAKSMLRGLAVQPAQKRATGRTDPTAIRGKAASRKMQPGRHGRDISSSGETLSPDYAPPPVWQRIVSVFNLRPILSPSAT